MGIGSKLKKLRRKVVNTAKDVGQGAIDAARAPIQVVKVAAQGGSRTEILKEIGKGAAGAIRASTGGAESVIRSGVGQKITNSSTFNKITLNTGREVNQFYTGNDSLRRRQTVDSNFYKSASALGAKALAVGATSAYLSGSKATTGAIEVTSQTAVPGATFGPAPVVTSTSLTASGTAASTLPTLGTVAKYGAGLSIAKKLLGGDVAGAADDLGFGGLFPEDSSGESSIGAPENIDGYTPTILGINQNMFLIGGALLATTFILVKKKVI